tara:strand:+ start:28 stop:486 length:459 start_codon:yes stop_codon:yes gene_type:complete
MLEEGRTTEQPGEGIALVTQATYIQHFGGGCWLNSLARGELGPRADKAIGVIADGKQVDRHGRNILHLVPEATNRTVHGSGDGAGRIAPDFDMKLADWDRPVAMNPEVAQEPRLEGCQPVGPSITNHLSSSQKDLSCLADEEVCVGVHIVVV